MAFFDNGQPGYIFYKGLLVGITSYVFLYLIMKVDKEIATQRALFMGLIASVYIVIFGPKIFGEINPALQL